MLLLVNIIISLWLVQQNPYEETHETFLSSDLASEIIDPTDFNSALLNLCIFHASNEMREKYGFSIFSYRKSLSCAAQKHAEDMRTKSYFSHRDKKGKYSEDRIQDCGGNSFTDTGENIAKYYPLNINYKKSYYPVKRGAFYEYRYTGSKALIPAISYAEFARYIVDQWYHSKGHRENLTNLKFQFLGCGTAITDHAMQEEEIPSVYLVQNFGGKNW